MTLAIQGHPKRGSKVIEILEMLGGNNIYNLSGNCCNIYYIIEGFEREIRIRESIFDNENICLFTLEEFEEKFPYKVGDKVYNIIHNENQTITEVAWDFQEDVVVYQTNNNEYLFVNYLQPYKEQETIDKTKFPYEIGTRVSVKSPHIKKLATIVGLSYNSCACMQYEIQFDGEDVVVHYPTDLMTPIITEQYMEEKDEKSANHIFDKEQVFYRLESNKLFVATADELKPYKKEVMEEIKVDIPKGYEFAGVDDDKQQVVFTKVGYHYPQTYNELLYPIQGQRIPIRYYR